MCIANPLYTADPTRVHILGGYRYWEAKLAPLQDSWFDHDVQVAATPHWFLLERQQANKRLEWRVV